MINETTKDQVLISSYDSFGEGVCCDTEDEEAMLVSFQAERQAKSPEKKRPPHITIPNVPDTPGVCRSISKNKVIHLQDIDKEIGVAFRRMQQASKDDNKRALKIYTREFEVLMSARATLFNASPKNPEWNFEYFNPV